LYETNKELRELAQDELDQPDTRRRIESQAAAEKANGRRLTSLTAMGEDLVRQAMRNPEIGVGHLEKWAEMLQILKDISANRMPTVADLLKQASQAQAAATSPEKAQPKPVAGMVRDTRTGQGASPKPDENEKPKPVVPAVVDRESSQQPLAKPKEGDDEEEPPPAGGKPRLTLPVTTVVGTDDGKKQACPAGQKVDEAVEEQRDLLAEFEKIADELNKVLANLEGSTLLKRLKAASRQQYKIAGRINDQVNEAFGVAPSLVDEVPSKVLDEMAGEEGKESQTVSAIMDDMHAFYERRKMAKFKAVLDEMRETDVIGSLRQLGDDLRKENGISIAQAEFWSDTLDRWADDLIDPARGGT